MKCNPFQNDNISDWSKLKEFADNKADFYVPTSIDRLHIVFALSVSLLLCMLLYMSVTLSQKKNYNIGHNFE